MSVSDKRGSRYYGRGHKKHKSGSKGGCGFAGANKHNKLWVQKMRARIPVPKDKYIHFEVLFRRFPEKVITETNDSYIVDTRKCYKILGCKKEYNSKTVKYIGSRHARIR